MGLSEGPRSRLCSSMASSMSGLPLAAIPEIEIKVNHRNSTIDDSETSDNSDVEEFVDVPRNVDDSVPNPECIESMRSTIESEGIWEFQATSNDDDSEDSVDACTPRAAAPKNGNGIRSSAISDLDIFSRLGTTVGNDAPKESSILEEAANRGFQSFLSQRNSANPGVGLGTIARTSGVLSANSTRKSKNAFSKFGSLFW